MPFQKMRKRNVVELGQRLLNRVEMQQKQNKKWLTAKLKIMYTEKLKKIRTKIMVIGLFFKL